MKVFKKQWFAFIILILAIGGSIAIGFSRHESRKESNDRVFRDADLNTEMVLSFKSVFDKEKILSDDTENKIQIYNANWEDAYQSVVWLETYDKASESIDKFAENETYRLGAGKRDAVLILLEGSDNFVFYAGEEFPYSFNKQRAQEIINIISAAYESDLDSGILRAYNKLNEYYKSEDVIFEEEEEEEEGLFEDFFNDPSYDTFRESIDKIVETASGSEKDEKIRCFSKNSNFVVEKTDSSVNKNSNNGNKTEKKGFWSKWKIIVLVIVVLGILGGRKKTSYK